MPRLIAPTAGLHDAWLDAHAEWGPGLHEDGFGVRASDDVRSAAGFAAWVARVSAAPLTRWIVESAPGPVANGETAPGAHRTLVLGGIAVRTGPPDFVAWAGHVGFGIRPSHRGRGLAGWALGEIREPARRLGLGRLVVVCDQANVASARTIEGAGGVFEGLHQTPYGRARRYVIGLG